MAKRIITTEFAEEDVKILNESSQASASEGLYRTAESEGNTFYLY